MAKLFKQTFILFALMVSVSSYSQGTTADLNGEWLVDFVSQDVGYVRMVMYFEAKDSAFRAYTRKGAAKDMLGGKSAFLAKMFAGVKGGSFIRVGSGKIKNGANEKILRGIFLSPLGNYYFNGSFSGDSWKADLLTSDKVTKGKLIAHKTSHPTPLSDYKTITQKALETARKEIFSATITDTKEWKGFEEKITGVAGKAQDDLEIIFAFFNYARKVPVSHLALTKKNNHPDLNISEIKEPSVVIVEKDAKTVILKINAFDGSAAEMDEVFMKILPRQYKNLIVDLRKNPGGSIEAGMRFISYLDDSSYYGGIFLTRKYFDKHSQIPTLDKFGDFPHFTEANYDLIMEGLHNYEGMCVKVIPSKSTFKGNIFVLTSGITGSTCEPLVYALKQRKRATLVGERTAGKMLSSEPFDLPDGFQIYVPIGDYYTADGKRLDQAGVEPNVKMASEKALDYVLLQLAK